MTGTYARPSPEGGPGPRGGHSGRSPVLRRAGREARESSDAETSMGDMDVGDGLVVRDGRMHVAPARDPGELRLKAGLTTDQRIDALLVYINRLRRELAEAKLLGR